MVDHSLRRELRNRAAFSVNSNDDILTGQTMYIFRLVLPKFRLYNLACAINVDGSIPLGGMSPINFKYMKDNVVDKISNEIIFNRIWHD